MNSGENDVEIALAESGIHQAFEMEGVSDPWSLHSSACPGLMKSEGSVSAWMLSNCA